MNNINPDKLIKGEPYLIEYKGYFMAVFFNRYNEENDTLELGKICIDTGDGMSAEYCQAFPLPDIKSLTHLKRGEVIK